MEGRLAVELTNNCENSTSEKEVTPEEKIFRTIFADEDEKTLEKVRMLIEVELLERDIEESKSS